MKRYEVIRDYTFPYTWAVGLEKIPGLPAGGQGPRFMGLGVTQRKDMKREQGIYGKYEEIYDAI